MQKIEFFEEKNPWRVTGTRFNYFIGIVSLFGIPAIHQFVTLGEPSWWVAAIGIIFYIAEAWATLLRVNLSRARIIYQRSGGNFHDLNIRTREPGGMIWYGFLMRFCMRFALIPFVCMALGLDFGDDLPAWMIIIMCVLVLFELGLMMYTMYETRVYELYDKEDREEVAKGIEEEKKWRNKMENLARKPDTQLKEHLSNIILMGVGVLFVNAANDETSKAIYDFMKDASINPFSILFSLFTATVMFFIVILPMRLAYWLEEAMEVKNPGDKLKLNLSFAFAVLSLVVPPIIRVMMA